MHKFVNFNHQVILAENAFLSANSAAALYGRGIFTTVAIYNFKLFLWEKHWERLTADAKQIGVNFSDYTEQTVKKSLLDIVEKNTFRTGRARLTFYDESPPAIWQTDSKSGTSLLIQTADFRLIKDKFNLTVSPFRVNSKSTLAGVKSCNYLENILAWEAARTEDFDEAIRLNEKGEIVSACLANVFWKKGDVLFTPHLETGCLNGTTREFVLENLAVEQTKAQLKEILEADEIFLTSAGIGIVKAENIKVKD
jgi:branched-subunit amino acid aminotransferase/4-amino-4-deoxychorismate lyase